MKTSDLLNCIVYTERVQKGVKNVFPSMLLNFPHNVQFFKNCLIQLVRKEKEESEEWAAM